MTAEFDSLEQRIGYQFRDRELLAQSLTHRSHAQTPREVDTNNERLEFLGDSVLGLVASQRLMERFPDLPEGRLTTLKASLVRAENLADVARELKIGAYLRIGRGEEISGGRHKKGLLEDALEALIAAIYLDGGLEAASSFLDRTVLSETALDAAKDSSTIDNYKSALQEYLQARAMPAPTYEVVEETGPPHRKTFTMEVCVHGIATRAEGDSKKSAEQKAAQQALERLLRQDDQDDNDAAGNDAAQTSETEGSPAS
jgi:ribonuclease-3